MPLITCEMRWLLEGPMPGKVERWWQRGQRPAPESWRDDRYLLLPGVVDMGVKERQGRLEIKGRLAKLGGHMIGPDIEGSAERWCKWSYDATIAERFRSHQTVLVSKGRVQRHFLLDPGGRAQETALRDVTRRGFSLELTRVRMQGSPDHWSLGIEAAPDDAGLLDDLLRVLGDVLEGFPRPLPRARSRAYPAWLMQTVLRPADRKRA